MFYFTFFSEILSVSVDFFYDLLKFLSYVSLTSYIIDCQWYHTLDKGSQRACNKVFQKLENGTTDN